jgi:hypothetical protein
MDTTRGGEAVSAQIGAIGVIADLGTQNFRKEDTPFNVKNDGGAAVLLEVNLWGMPEGEFVKTRFDPGWNPEIVREIRQNETPDLDLKYGY